jgi:hypothetical protein
MESFKGAHHFTCGRRDIVLKGHGSGSSIIHSILMNLGSIKNHLQTLNNDLHHGLKPLWEKFKKMQPDRRPNEFFTTSIKLSESDGRIYQKKEFAERKQGDLTLMYKKKRKGKFKLQPILNELHRNGDKTKKKDE